MSKFNEMDFLFASIFEYLSNKSGIKNLSFNIEGETEYEILISLIKDGKTYKLTLLEDK